MDLIVSFANPIGPFDLFWNKCAGKYCHVEISVDIPRELLVSLLESVQDDCFDPERIARLLKRVIEAKDVETLNICFFVLWGEAVDSRFLSKLAENAISRPPEEPTYENIVVPLELEELKNVVQYSLRQVGKSYDIPRALLLFSPLTLRTDDSPEKFFCSQLVMHTFKQLDSYAEDMKSLEDINHMKPDDVYNWLSEVMDKRIKDKNTENKEE